MAYNEQFQFLLVHLFEVAQALNKGDRAIISVPSLSERENDQLTSRIIWLKLRICQAYKLTDTFRVFEKI
jgi:hypothetical protein